VKRLKYQKKFNKCRVENDICHVILLNHNAVGIFGVVAEAGGSTWLPPRLVNDHAVRIFVAGETGRVAKAVDRVKHPSNAGLEFSNA